MTMLLSKGFATTSTATMSTRSMLRWMWEHRPPKKVVLGVAIAMPVAAVLQGAILLNEFRQRHANAPTPVTPSRGVVVAVHQNNNNNNQNNKGNMLTSLTNGNPAAKLGEIMVQSASALLEQSSQEPPLRILVIGDSLAAGVGVSKTGTPVLPESIARTLSQRLGGRPVYWTCVGTPGASAARIVHDIETYNESLLVRQPSIPPEIIVTENWIQGIQRQWSSAQARRERVLAWWRALGKKEPPAANPTQGSDGTDTDDQKKEPRQIVKWWRRVRHEAQSLREAWKGPDAAVDSSNIATKDGGDESSDTKEMIDPFQRWLRWRQRLQRRSSLRNPEIVGQFDVAIVMTGLNDLKEAVLPFMFRGQNASDNAEYSSNDENKSLTKELERVLKALQRRMTLVLDRDGRRKEAEKEECVGYTLDDDDKNVEAELLQSIRDNETRLSIRRKTTRRRPLVVFPALPVSPLPIFRSQPLRWFALPLFRRVDNYKRQVANLFPGEVLFVEAPTDDVYSEIEEGTGSLWDERRTEQVLLRLTDITQRARDRVETVMRQHYDKWKNRMGGKESHTYNRQTPEEAQHSCEIDEFQRPGSSLIAVDGVHPNDAGYEFWGRHIANAICEEWEAQDRQRAMAE